MEAVTAPPYDVIGDEALNAYANSSPYNIVHLDREVEGDGEKYKEAARQLGEWIDSGVLIADPEPSYYAYEMRFRLEGRDRAIRGVFCAMNLEEWGGAVLPHERVLSGPVQDRLGLMRATRANLSAVYGTIGGPCQPLTLLLDEITKTLSPWRTVDEQGVIHSMWRITGQTNIAGWLEDENLLIADGHHRYTTALAYRSERSESDGPGPWDQVLTLVVDAGSEDPPVLPFHRVVMAGHPAAVGQRVRDLQEVLADLDDERLVYGVALREEERLVHRVAELTGTPPTVIALHEQVIGHDLIEAGQVRFTHDAVAAEAAVRDGEAVAAYFLPATTAERIRAVVDGGGTLPPKSTYFWPKPRTGMIIRVF